MSYLLHHPFYTLGYIYVIILVGRAILGFFPIEPSTFTGKLFHWLWVLTEPYLAPFRRVVPPIGGLDVSYMLGVVVMWLVTDLLLARIYV